MIDIKQDILSSEEGSCLNGNRYLLNNIDFIAEHIKDIDGDIVECGVWKGAMFSYMATVFPNRTMWAYDSFEGVPQNKEHTKYVDRYEAYDIKWSTCCPELSADVTFLQKSFIKYNIPNTERIHIIKGWFKDTLPNATHKIALLRVDGDLYSSTYEALEYLYPLVVSGGFVIFDDYSIHESKKAVHEYFANTKEQPKIYSVHNTEIDKYVYDFKQVGNEQGTFIQKP